MANSIPKIIYNDGVSDIEILFEYPPAGPDFEGASYNDVSTIKTSNNGRIQKSSNYKEKLITLDFRQVKKSIKDLVENFMLTHATEGKKFKYFYHNDEVDFEEVELPKNGYQFRPQRTGTPFGSLESNYSFRLQMRRVL